MTRFDGTAARQLDLMDLDLIDRGINDDERVSPAPVRDRQVRMRLLQKDVYAELDRRRRRAQIAARHLVEAEPAGALLENVKH